MANTTSDSAPRSRGAVLLGRVLEARRWRQQDMATILDVDRSMISHWIRGTRVPGRAWANKIARVWEIPADAWDTPARRGA